MSGLGTSSAFTVGLCKIMNFVKNNKIKQLDLAKQAIHIEQNKIKEFGSQRSNPYGHWRIKKW